MLNKKPETGFDPGPGRCMTGVVYMFFGCVWSVCKGLKRVREVQGSAAHGSPNAERITLNF
jgi:hypothetical protein